MSEEKPEVVETEIEADAAVAVIEPPQSTDQMDAVIAIAKRIEDYANAHDTIVKAIVKRSFPGDWVVHKKDGDKDEDQKANMGAAAAERMAAFIGISESNWTLGAKEWSEDRKHYTWAYEADFSFGRRTIHVISRVGTRDKFFGKKGGAWKPLEDVQEDDIKKAAFRACRKEGVRTLLGLRNVPVAKLIEMGFAKEKINIVGFEDKGKALEAKDKSVDAVTGLSERVTDIKELNKFESKDPKKPWIRYEMKDGSGVKFTLWGNGRRASVLSDAFASKATVKIGFKTTMYRNEEQYEIQTVNGIGDEKEAAS